MVAAARCGYRPASLTEKHTALTLESWYCPVPDTRLSLSIRYHCHGTRAILFSYGGKLKALTKGFTILKALTSRLGVALVSISFWILLTFPPLVNLWMPAVATPGMIKHTVMMAKPGKISYHMVSASHCQATKLPLDCPRQFILLTG